jgi:glycine cleavage system H protein
MAAVEGCNIPENLYYWIEKHVWVKSEETVVLIGLSDVAQSLAGKIIVVNLKATGKTLARGKSGGTLESGKWVGSIPTPVAGEVIEVNQAVKANPGLVNDDPYGQGWLLKIKPSNWEEDKILLATGEKGVQSYREKLQQDGIKCAQ